MNFRQRYPHVSIEFVLGPEPVDLVEDCIDVAIHIGALVASQFICRRVAESRWILCASPEYIQREGMPLEPADLHRHQCLNFLSRQEWNRWPLQGQLAPFKAEHAAFATNQGEMMLELARQGLGIVRLAHYHVARDLREGRLLPVLESFNLSAPQPIYILYPSRRNLSPRVRHFCDFIIENFDGEAPWLKALG